MAQFDVHINPGPRRDQVPYVVSVQSASFDRYRRRLVVPLARISALPPGIKSVGTRTNPIFEINGERVLLNPLDMVSVDLKQLGAKVISFADEGQTIADALDEVFTRSWG